jgi:hypothetical protein
MARLATNPNGGEAFAKSGGPTEDIHERATIIAIEYIGARFLAIVA